MSAWRLVVRELYLRGPLQGVAIRSLFTSQSLTGPYQALRTAAHMGLVRPPGRGTNKPYTLTEAGQSLVENRLAAVVPEYRTGRPRGGRPRGTQLVLRPTWLASLPPTNEIRLQTEAAACQPSA